MIKWLLPIVLICWIVAGCTKSDSDFAKYKAQAATDDKIVANYIEAHGLSAVAKKTSDTSGVYYIIEQQGTGNDLYSSSTLVTVADTASLLSTGTIFYETNDFHPAYILGQTILAWQYGLPKIKKGGLIRLLVPSRYAYGPFPQDNYKLPANAILDFKIRVYDITNTNTN